MKTSISVDDNKDNSPRNTEPNSNIENKIQNKKIDDNINKKESKHELNKKKKSLREHYSKKNKNNKLAKKQKTLTNLENKEKMKPLKRKENQILFDNVNYQKYNITVYDNKDKDKENYKKEINIKSIIKPKKSETKNINHNQTKKQTKIKEKNKISKKNTNNNKPVKNKELENNDKNIGTTKNKNVKDVDINLNKKEGNNKNVKNQIEAEININKKEGINKNINNEKEAEKNLIKKEGNNKNIINKKDVEINLNKNEGNNKNINNEKEIKQKDNGNINKDINNNKDNKNKKSIEEKTEIQNFAKNIIIKRDLSNSNNNSIYISKNRSCKSNTNVIQNAQNNNTIFISSYCGTKKNNNIISNVCSRKNSQDLFSTRIKLNNQNNDIIQENNTAKKNISTNIIHNIYKTDIKNIKSDNKRIIHIYQNKINNYELSILNQKNNSNNIKKNLNNNFSNNNNKNINNNIKNDSLIHSKNNHININVETKQKGETNLKKATINNVTKNNSIQNYSNMKLKNKEINKKTDKTETNSNNIQYKINKVNRQNRSLINNRVNKNKQKIINIKLSHNNNSTQKILNKNKIIQETFNNNNYINNHFNKNNFSKYLQNNKKPTKIIIQNVVIENNATNNNIFFSNNIIAPNNYLINSIKEPIVPINNNKNDTLMKTQKIKNATEIHKNVIIPLTEDKFFANNINNLNLTSRKPEINSTIKLDAMNQTQTMNNTMTSIKNIKQYPFNRSNSDTLVNQAEKIIYTDRKNSSTLVEMNDSMREQRINALNARSKSLLSGRPKAKCPICDKMIETHLLQIHINAHPSKIFNWLYLGTFENACDNEELRRINIKYILNCAIECKNKNIPKDIQELHLKIRDNIDFDIMPFIKQSNEYINKVRLAGGIILIHCKLGISRSAALVIAYLIKYYGFDFDSALKFIKNQRVRINPNIGFVEQLKEYEKTVKNKNKKK